MKYMHFQSLIRAVRRPLIIHIVGRRHLSLSSVANKSTKDQNLIKSATSETPNVADIPEPPLKIIDSTDLTALGEPTLSSLGLCSNMPWGWYQYLIENIHVGLDIPWWGAISLTTVAFRLLLFPAIVNQRKTLATFSNLMPRMTELQTEFTKARLSKDMIKMSNISNEMMELQNKEGFSMFKTMKPMILQIPIFLSVFNGLRGMANLPVDSLKTGGLLWFTDLTIPDPYFVLPAITMGSMLLMFEFGVDVSTQAVTPTMRWFLRGAPVVGFFFILNTPSAIVWYWATSNLISIIQSFTLRAPAVKKMLKLPDPPKTQFNAQKSEGPIKSFRESLTNARLMAEIENRERMDASNWQKSGTGPVPKTFAHNPLSSDQKVSKRVVKIVRKAQEEMKKNSGSSN